MNLTSIYQPKLPDRTTTESNEAFTFLELLLVIGVLGILAALLLPTLQRGKERAKTIQCTNNQRQLAITWLMYAADNTDKLAANGIPIRVPTQNIKWIQGSFIIAEDSTNQDWLLNPQWSLFAKYITNARTYVCPGEPPTVNYQGSLYPRVRSYAMNNFLGWEGFPSTDIPMTNWLTPQKLCQVPNPGEIFLTPDVNASSICWPYFGTYMDRNSFFNFPGATHNRAAVISFCDGHVDRHRWVDPNTIAGHSDNYHRHDDPFPGNVDIHWLQSHATRPR